jgi:hypothetical protein
MKKTVTISLAAVVCLVSILIAAETKKAVNPLRVGVYDSRAIAIASGPTEWFNKPVREKMKEMEKAKAANDQQKIKELEEWGQQQQQKSHLMAFGTAPVQHLLEPVKDKLPEVAQKAGVDIIISKWQIDYQAEGAEFVDITDAMVALYNPNEKVLKSVEAMKNLKPYPQEELLKVKD